MATIYLASARDRQGVAEIAREEGIDYSFFEKCYRVVLFQKPDKYIECLDDIARDYSGKTVVIIDDEPDLLQMTEYRLDGCVVHAYTNPREAIDDIKNGRVVPVVVVTDLQMPVMNGFDVIREIREWEKGLYDDGHLPGAYSGI